jgi:GH24 family phage-related lysozyme (muramidase)
VTFDKQVNVQNVDKKNSKDVKSLPFVKPDINFKKDAKTIQNVPFKATSDFINYVKSTENAGKSGYNVKLKKWFPHKSPEGGLDTIGYGHKFKDTTEQEKYRKNGATDAEVTDMLSIDLAKAKLAVDSNLKDMKISPTKPLSQEQMEMLIDFAYNLGNVKGFPKFVKAVVSEDWKTAKNEYKRKYKTSTGKIKELDRRNKLFFDKYLKTK